MSQGNRRAFRLIGLTGKPVAGSGKDTVAQSLTQIGFVRQAFADPIKYALNAIFGWTMEQWEDREWKETKLADLGFSPRRAAQTLGTEWGRSMHQALWVQLVARELARYDSMDHELVQRPVGMVISDVRFEDEATWVRENHGQVWHILRPGIASVESHVSEKGVAIAPGDIVIHNVGSREGLQRGAQIIAREEE